MLRTVVRTACLVASSSLIKPKMVGYRGSIEPDLLGDLLVRQTKLILQVLECFGPLHRVEVFPLYVLNDGPLCSGPIIDVLNHSWNTIEPYNLRRTKPAFTSNQFVPTC